MTQTNFVGPRSSKVGDPEVLAERGGAMERSASYGSLLWEDTGFKVSFPWGEVSYGIAPLCDLILDGVSKLSWNFY